MLISILKNIQKLIWSVNYINKIIFSSVLVSIFIICIFFSFVYIFFLEIIMLGILCRKSRVLVGSSATRNCIAVTQSLPKFETRNIS